MSNRLNNSSLTPIDLLADLVSKSHRETLFSRNAFRGDWGFSFDQVAAGFHIVTEGTAHLSLEDSSTTLRRGDIALLTQAHSISNQASTKLLPFSNSALATVSCDEEKSDTVMLCGAYVFDNLAEHPLMCKLPTLVLLSAESADDTVQQTIDLLDAELKASQPGSTTIAKRLIDSLLVHVLRYWITTDCPESLVWLRASGNTALAQALSLIHYNYQTSWTLDTLASAANTSRGTLARRFSEEVGVSPIQFLTQRRLSVAKTLLCAERLELETIAERVGYSSAFALSKAFKREFGVAPSHYKKSMIVA